MTQATNLGAELVAEARAKREPLRQLPAIEERKRIRAAAGLSLQRLGESLGVSAQTIWNWENGQDGPSPENALRYAELLAQIADATEAAS